MKNHRIFKAGKLISGSTEGVAETIPALSISEFSGTSNPREVRVLRALASGPVTRLKIDSLAGAANGPDLIANLRSKGLDLPCQMAPYVDRDDRIVQVGVYIPTSSDIRQIRAFLVGQKVRS